MRHSHHLRIAVLAALLLTGCIPANPPPPASTAPAAAEPANAGPYWHSSGQGVNQADALAYYTALKTLTKDELSREHERLVKGADSPPDNRLPALQKLLLAALPEQELIEAEQAIKLLETARQDADLHRELAGLFVLIGDQLASRLTVHSKNKQESQTLRASLKKCKTQNEALTACRKERDDLAAKLQKLQDIERGLMERELKK